MKFTTLNFNSTSSLPAFQHQSKHSRTWSNNSLGGPKANTQFFITKGTRFDHEIQYWHHNAILLSIVCTRERVKGVTTTLKISLWLAISSHISEWSLIILPLDWYYLKKDSKLPSNMYNNKSARALFSTPNHFLHLLF